MLVHGAWHGAWCWATLQAELDRRGVASLALDLPGHGTSTDALSDLHGDADALSALLDQLNERHGHPIVLAGHSYGGAVITQAAIDRTDIDHLAYLAAFALDANESVMGALGSMERRDVALSASMVPTADNSATTLDPATAPNALYNQCDAAAISAALPRLSPQPIATMTQETTGNPREHTKSTYVVCAQDNAVHPDHQAVMAGRCTHRVDIDTDHSPFISAVGATADVLERLARATEAAS